jgi:hypothetical protein
VPHANAGSGATAAIIAGTDTAFEVRITTGTSGTFGLQATVTFSRTWASKPFCVVTGADAQGAASGSATYCDRTGSSTTQLKINSDSPLTSSVEHRWIVVCLP